MPREQHPGRGDGLPQDGRRWRCFVDEAAMFKAAGHPARIRILADLQRSDRDAAALRRHVGDDPPSLWGHLATLRRAGLIDRRASGEGGPTYGLTGAGRAMAGIIAQLIDGGLLPE